MWRKSKRSKEKKRDSRQFWVDKKEKRKKIVKDVPFSTFLKAATPTKLQQKRRPLHGLQHKVIDLEKSWQAVALFTCTYIKKRESLLTI